MHAQQLIAVNVNAVESGIGESPNQELEHRCTGEMSIEAQASGCRPFESDTQHTGEELERMGGFLIRRTFHRGADVGRGSAAEHPAV